MAESPNGDKLTDGDALFGNGNTAETGPAIAVAQNNDDNNEQAQKGVDNVLYSDIGINTLLTRLKQSLASARDYAGFLKKRSSLEEDHANGLRRLAKSHQESIRKQDCRQGSYLRQLEEVMRQHERMADNGMQFTLSIHQMHEDLNELSRNIELGRKHWKHEGLNAEKRASDAATAMDKAKLKYDGLAEDYDRARTGDAKGRRLGLKGPKSAAQHEEDLLRKLQAADSDYQQKVHTARAMREELIRTGRPQAVKALQELITECDSGLALQLQKFATFNEKLLLGNGLVVSPLPPAEGEAPQRSMRDVVSNIDNHKDFHTFMIGHTSKIPIRQEEIQYKQHPTLQPKQQTPAPRSPQPSGSVQEPPSSSTSAPVTFSSPGAPPQAYNSADHRRSFQRDASPQPQATPTSAGGQPYSSYQANPSYGPQPVPNNPPYPSSGSSVRGLPVLSPTSPVSYPNQPSSYTEGPSSVGVMGQQHSQGNGQSLPQPSQPSTGTSAQLPPLKPVFGVKLEDLFHRDGTAVPMVVYQCMQAVDLFGLDVEGIYRIPGTTAQVQQLKALFDHDSASVDFRNPSTFSHDINSVTSLLKTFFRDLPEPLFTHTHYNALIDAARIDDNTQRRDTIHAIINELPDSHYATLRALVLHLERVRQSESRNRMGTQNLSICLAPTLMGTGAGEGAGGLSKMGDTGLQARVLVTVLENTFQIFDED